MSTETDTSTANVIPPAVAPAIAAIPSTGQAAIPPAAEQPKPKGAVVEIPSDKLAERFAEERRKGVADYVKSLGLGDEAAVKAAVETHQRLLDEKRTDLEKRDARISALEPKAQRADELEAIVKTMLDEQEKGLSPEQRTILALVGSDIGKRLQAVQALRSYQPAAPIAPPPAPLPIATPVNTAPPNAAPPPPANGGTVDHLAVWESLNNGGHPIQAAAYHTKHRDAIIAAKKARGDYSGR